MANKAQLIEALSERLGDKKVASEAVDGLVDIIIRTVNKGEKVNITGFGVFEKRARAARTARNPRTGETVRVGAEETLLSALGSAGVHASYSCQQGFCGTCRTRVLDGTVDHRDTLLTDPERDNGMMLICISRAADGSHLTLDL